MCMQFSTEIHEMFLAITYTSQFYTCCLLCSFYYFPVTPSLLIWHFGGSHIYSIPIKTFIFHQNFLPNLLSQLGLDISPEKLVPPATAVTCLGILIATKSRTLSTN